jgi:small subunit ribosomal protein S27e
MVQGPKGEFHRVRCECKNEQIIFNKAATNVVCLVCDQPLAKSAGGKAKILARTLEVLK